MLIRVLFTAAVRLAIYILVMLGPAGASAQVGSKPSPEEETITIDGAKNPEMVPQWSVWESSFRFIATGTKTLGDDGIPTKIYIALDKEHRLLLMKRVDAAIQGQKDCETRTLKLRAQLGLEKFDVLQARVLDLQMECRRGTLKARDNLLAALPPEGQSALRAFVESMKQGITITVLKSDLARFRLPE